MAESADGPFVAPEREPQGDLAFWGEPSWRESVRRPRAHGSWLEELGSRLRDGRVGVVALVVLALVAGVVFYKLGAGSGDASATPAPASNARRARDVPPTDTAGSVPTTGDAPASSTPGASAAPAAKVSGSRVVVHVAGAVVTPGVVQLTAGSRVIDAVEAAGGGLPNADLDRLNLAAKVVDGERVLVQHVGDPPAAVDATGSTGDTSVGGVPAGPLNLNTATQAQLEQLPGIGPALAQAIVAERTRKGGFRSLNELREVRGIGERRFADLKNLVTV